MLEDTIIKKALTEYVSRKMGRYHKLKQEALKTEYFKEIKEIVDYIGFDSLTKKSKESYNSIYNAPAETEVEEEMEEVEELALDVEEEKDEAIDELEKQLEEAIF